MVGVGVTVGVSVFVGVIVGVGVVVTVGVLVGVEVWVTVGVLVGINEQDENPPSSIPVGSNSTTWPENE